MSSLDPNTIAKLLKIPTQTLQHRVNEVVEQSLEKLEWALGRTNSFIRPRIVYDLVGTTAGQAQYQKSTNTYTIRLNLGALQSNDLHIVAHMYEHTIPHEVAHIVEFQLYSQAGHGFRWKHLMYLLGVQPNRTHNLPLPPARKTVKFKYRCSCSLHMVGKNRHTKMQTNPHYKLSCTRCGGLLERVVE